MRLLMKVNASSEFEDEINTGFVSVDRGLAKLILSRMKALRKAAEPDGSLLHMDYYDEAFVYLAEPKLDKDEGKAMLIREQLEDGIIVPVEEDYSKYEEVVEMESSYMRIMREGVCWLGFVKYSTTEFFSEAIQFNEIEKAL